MSHRAFRLGAVEVNSLFLDGAVLEWLRIRVGGAGRVAVARSTSGDAGTRWTPDLNIGVRGTGSGAAFGGRFLFLDFFDFFLRLSEKGGLGLLELDELPLVAASDREREWERLRENFSLGMVCFLRLDGRRPRGPGDRER